MSSSDEVNVALGLLDWGLVEVEEEDLGGLGWLLTITLELGDQVTETAEVHGEAGGA